MIQALNQILKHSPFAYFYHSVSCKILDNNQSFRTFIFLKLKMDIYHFLEETRADLTLLSYEKILCSNCDDSKSNIQTFAIRQTWTKVHKSGQKWTKVDKSAQNWTKVDTIGHIWT
jgi:hypothetical protein